MKRKHLLLFISLVLGVSLYAQTTLEVVMDGFVRETKPDDNYCAELYGGTYANPMLKCKAADNRHSVIFFDISGLTETINAATLKIGYSGSVVWEGGDVEVNLADYEETRIVVSVKTLVKPENGAGLTATYVGLNTDYILVDTIAPTDDDKNTYIEVTGDSLVYQINKLVGDGATELCVTLYRVASDDGVSMQFYSAATHETTLPPVVEITSGTASIDKIHTKNINFYPNPASDYIELSTAISSLDIYDITGKLVKSVKNNQSKIDISELDEGMYVVKYNINNNTLTSKLLVK